MKTKTMTPIKSAIVEINGEHFFTARWTMEQMQSLMYANLMLKRRFWWSLGISVFSAMASIASATFALLRG